MQQTYAPQLTDSTKQTGWLILPGNRGIGRGPLALVSETRRVEIFANSVYIKPLRDLTDEDALALNFTLKRLKEMLRKTYENICDGDNITIITWNPNEPIGRDTEEADLHVSESPH